MYIDAHQHFWKFDPLRDSWIDDDMKVIRKDFFPADLLPVLKREGFDGSVLVQSDQSEAENVFQLKNAEENDFIKGVVGWVDLRSVDVEERLNHYSQFQKLKGFRHVLQGESDRALMLKPEFKRGIAALSQFRFTYDILVFPDQLKFIPDLIEAFPDQKFVIDHMAKPFIRDGEIEEWKKDMQAIAVYDNVWCKISGMVTEADWKNWKESDFTPYLDHVIDSFGINRMMYGSDWPVCLLAASYEEVVTIVRNYFSTGSDEEKDLVFGGNAKAFYSL